MRLESFRGSNTSFTMIVLSRRNLLTLLAKLDGFPKNSECMIGAPEAYGEFYVKAEEDDEHYNHPSRIDLGIPTVPGAMHPETEYVIGYA